MKLVAKSQYTVRSILHGANRSTRTEFYVLDRIARKQTGPSFATSIQAHDYLLSLVRNSRI